MGPEGGTAMVDDERQADMTDHNGVLMMQRLLLAGTLGLAVAQKAAAILDGDRASGAADQGLALGTLPAGADPKSHDGAVLRAILDAANECLGHFDERPPGERWCDALLHLLDLAAFAADLGSAAPVGPPAAAPMRSRWAQTGWV